MSHPVDAVGVILAAIVCIAATYLTRVDAAVPMPWITAVTGGMLGLLSWDVGEALATGKRDWAVLKTAEAAWVAWCVWQQIRRRRPPRRRRRRVAKLILSIRGRLVVVPAHQPS